MRYYDIVITPQSTEGVSTLGLSTSATLNTLTGPSTVSGNRFGFTAGSSEPVARRWTSHPNGKFDPGALNVEFDIPVAPFGNLSDAASLLIEGVPLQDLFQSEQFAGMNLTLRAGMKAGLPLANPNQSGLIVGAQIFQSFGNWEGTEMTLDFVLFPGQYTLDQPGNIVLNWKAGMKLSDALQQTLSVAYPTMPLTINISSSLVQSHDEVARCYTLQELGQLIQSITRGNFLGDDYDGVYITIQGGRITVLDRTYRPNTVELSFSDFVGQPTWIDNNIMQIKLVMRADIQLNSILEMPRGLQSVPGLISSTAASLPSSNKYKSTFTGEFTVIKMRHVGNFRAADGASWVTIVDCTPIPERKGTVTVGPTTFEGVVNGG
ncbi:hypothetical protein ACVCIH_17630 [Burkholderia glumae]|uniref:hypothetical protein n=1 Tax=Burkholderia glumae TaxID=337 RepID=UPI0020369CE9|nr:hypothetical protein [Burkholderia glumae]MCM2493316.1 hypothetical protein [Burkholderia glumae]